MTNKFTPFLFVVLLCVLVGRVSLLWRTSIALIFICNSQRH